MKGSSLYKCHLAAPPDLANIVDANACMQAIYLSHMGGPGGMDIYRLFRSWTFTFWKIKSTAAPFPDVHLATSIKEL